MLKYKKMDPEIKRAWVKALRSGKYKQGQQSLKSADGYCCLGVLCAIEGQPKNWMKADVDAGGLNDTCYYYREPGRTERYWGTDYTVYEEAYFEKGMPPIPTLINAMLTPEAADELAKMNDSGSDFDDIADWIEANL